MTARVRPQKESAEDEDVELVESITATLNSDESPETPPRTEGQVGAQRKFVRIAYYSAVLSILSVIVFAWLSSYYVIALETKLNESTAATLQQLDARVARLELGGGQQPKKPKIVQYTPQEGAPRLGSSDAKVTIIEFADFQCPFCGRFQETVYTQLKKDYIDTGKASFVYQDFAFLGDESVIAAEAAKCAGDQGKFWEYHDYLFTHQKGENEGAFAAKNLKSFAKILQLNTVVFNKCLDSRVYEKAVEQETEAGRAVGISGTPTVIINGKVLVGALPYESFKEAIDEALAQ